jgi:hypothetical protein
MFWPMKAICRENNRWLFIIMCTISWKKYCIVNQLHRICTMQNGQLYISSYHILPCVHVIPHLPSLYFFHLPHCCQFQVVYLYILPISCTFFILGSYFCLDDGAGKFPQTFTFTFDILLTMYHHVSK